MSDSPPARDMRGVRLEATIRKALADVWALGVTKQEANKLVFQMVHEKFPEKTLPEISELIQKMRGGLA